MAPTPGRPARSRAARRVLLAAGFGNFMEWFDFAVYGFLATTIGSVFFPAADATGRLLAALGVFGVALLMRPLGGAVFGIVGDRYGRRAALSGSVIVMAVSTTLIAFLPGYATAGVLAPVLLVLLRCAQGFSIGGEWAGSSVFLVEQAPRHRRALWGSVVPATAGAGALAGALVTLGLSVWLSGEAMSSWGWRVPFILAAPLGVAGFYVRTKLEDTPEFQAVRRADSIAEAPLREALRENRRAIALVFFATATAAVGFYYLVTSVPNFLTSARVGLSEPAALAATAGGLAVYSALCPLAGVLADRFGRRPTMLLGAAGLVVVAVPAFLLMATGSVPAVLLGMAVLGLFEAMVNVTMVVLLIELFPARTRMSGCTTGFNLAGALLGSPAPAVVAWLAAGFDFAGSGALYLVAVALMTFLALVRMLPETRGRDLADHQAASASVPVPAMDRKTGAPA
ncbi:MFS transporter [Crossiella sp. SN42]|uniref:MFS transporter n=1 Tax=Crossiella sp. SN42 TaxID=2944808 RepID=UPI00207CF333|nr:MFS transporter [Crossiella sp. SN42]MCO1577331.1 MFS transporter [Crossiella sp. SN42]